MTHPAVYIATAIGFVAAAICAFLMSNNRIEAPHYNRREDGFQYYDTDANSNCTICLEPCVTHRGVLSCGHVFHRNCIVGWLRNSNLCPNCMKPAKLI